MPATPFKIYFRFRNNIIISRLPLKGNLNFFLAPSLRGKGLACVSDFAGCYPFLSAFSLGRILHLRTIISFFPPFHWSVFLVCGPLSSFFHLFIGPYPSFSGYYLFLFAFSLVRIPALQIQPDIHVQLHQKKVPNNTEHLPNYLCFFVNNRFVHDGHFHFHAQKFIWIYFE